MIDDLDRILDIIEDEDDWEDEPLDDDPDIPYEWEDWLPF